MSTATKLAVEVVNGNPAECILVIAPNHQRFTDWCRENDINPRARNVVCVTRGDHLRGHYRAWYVFLGVPDSTEGQHMGRMLEHWKALGDLKNAEVITDAKEDPPDGT